MLTKIIQFNSQNGWTEPFPDWDGPSTLALLFGDSTYLDNAEPIREIRRAFPNAHVLGCSTAGQIVKDSILDNDLVVTFVKFDHATLRIARSGQGCISDPRSVGRTIANDLNAENLRGVFVLSDGTSMNGTLLAEGLREGLPSDICATGGLAGDGQRFERTWVCCDSDPEEGIVAAIGIYGSKDTVGFWHGCKGGWDSFGPERLITGSQGELPP